MNRRARLWAASKTCRFRPMTSTARARRSGSGGSRSAARLSPLLGAVAEWLRSGLQSRLHRFDSGRRLSVLRVPLMRLAVLMAIGGGLGLAPGCGGDDGGDKGDDPQVVRAQDAQAKADARNLVSTVEACYVEQQTYESCGTAEALGGSGLAVGSGSEQGELRKADATSFEAVGHSKSGTTFTIVKKPDGSVGRSCDAPGKGGCSA